MTAYTLTKNTTLRDLTVAGGYSARSGGDSIANTNGWSFTIDQDTQYGLGSPAIAAATSGSLGSITQTAASGGDIIVDSRFVRLIPFNTGSGTLAIDGSTQTIGSATCVVIGIYTAMNVAPATTGASGWLKVTAWNSVDFPTSGAFTKSGFTFTITGASVPGWIEIVGDDAASAFPQNDLGKPDYDGHRKSHILMINDANVVAGYKQSVTKQVLSIIVTAIVTLLLAGVVSYFNAHSLPIAK